MHNFALAGYLALLGLGIAPFASAVAETRSFQRTFAVEPGGKLRVESDIGEIQVTGAAVNQVAVSARIVGSASEVENFLIDAAAANGTVSVTGKAAKSSWWRSGSRNLQVAYSIEVPETYRAELTTAGGDLKVTNVHGQVDARTAGGDIELRDIGGPLEARTSGGDIEVERATGSLMAQTSGGDIQLAGIKGDAEVRTSGGDIRISQVEGQVNAKTSGGDVQVSASPQQQGIDVATSGGSIDIRLPKAARANIDAATNGGAVEVTLPVKPSGRVEEDKVQGQINGGGPLVRARTSGGSIRIRAKEE